jgi:tetratricopeptide (TPR) repeat protein
MYQKGLDVSVALAQADPNNAQAKRDLAVSYERLGDVHLRLGATDKALEMHQKDLDLSVALAQADPNNVQAKRDLAVSYNKLGDVQLRLGATDEALEMYQKGLDVRVPLAKADSNNAQAQRDLSVSYNKLGDVQLQLGATDKALEMYQKGLEVIVALAQADPNNAQAQSDLAYSYRKLGEAYQKAREVAQARTHFERALDVDTKRTLQLPRDARARRDLAVDCERLASLSFTTRDWARAAEFAKRAIANAHAAHRIEGDDVRDDWEYSIDFQLLGNAQAKAGRLKEASQSLEAAIEADPKWAVSHNGLAWLLATAWDASIRDGPRAVALATKACELTEWKDAAYLDTLAASYAEAGQFAEAVKRETKALETPEALGDDLEPARARLKLYQAGKPYHEPQPQPVPSR